MTKKMSAVSLLTAIFLLACASHANAAFIDSTGSDGEFWPTSSTVLDSSKSIFNFTDIFIPTGVTVSFSGIASDKTIEFLATGNVYIAGVLDAGANNLVIDTPDAIFLTGVLKGLSFASTSNSFNFVGGTIAVGGGLPGSGTINIGGGGVPWDGGGAIITGGGSLPPRVDENLPPVYTCDGSCITLLAVPEPDTVPLLGIGLVALSVVTSRKKIVAT